MASKNKQKKKKINKRAMDQSDLGFFLWNHTKNERIRRGDVFKGVFHES